MEEERGKVHKNPNSTIMMSNIQIMKALFAQTWRVLSYLYTFQIIYFSSIVNDNKGTEKCFSFYTQNNEFLLLMFYSIFCPFCWQCFAVYNIYMCKNIFFIQFVDEFLQFGKKQSYDKNFPHQL